MIDPTTASSTTSFWASPAGIGLLALGLGFVIAAAAKLYGFVFMRWKTPFRVGEAMNVRRAEVTEWSDGEGYVSAGGELWRATSNDQLAAGDKVNVASVNGLLLTVKKANK